MKLLYFALLCEAQYFIEQLKAIKINSSPKIYIHDKVLIVIGGVGKQNTIKTLDYIFNQYQIEKIFNIGVAGTHNTNIKIGELFCTTHHLKNINFTTIYTTSTINNTKTNATLIDMEAKYIYQISQQYLQNKIFIYLK